MAKRRKSNDGAAVTVSLLLLLTCVSCALIIVLHNNGLVDQVAMAFPHRLADDEGAATSKRKGLSAIIAVPGGRLAPSPCGENGVLLHRTVEALLDSSGDVLMEIIVVEDGTVPAIQRPDLTGMAWTELQIPRQEAGSDLIQGVQLLWLRLAAPQGTAAARSAGGEAARGEALAFFDCYVKPQTGWAEPIMKLLRKHPKSVAVPALVDLDAKSWETSGPPRFFDNLFTWEAETVQLYFDEHVTWPHPIDQSNVLVFSWSWWQEIGGYDSLMKGSSTLLIENVELSLRVLLCGGKFVLMNESVVGFCHQQHGTLHHERRDTLFNQARVIQAWFGPWSSEALKNPRFDRDTSAGEMSDVRAVQENLKCAGLEKFLDTYRVPMEILGLLPSEVYSLREESTGLCLQEWSKDEWKLGQCHDSARGQLFTGKNERVEGGKLSCCSGLGPFKTLLGSNSYCRLGKPGPYGCIHRRPPNSQVWTLREDGQIFSEENGCLVPAEVDEEELPSNEATWSPCRFATGRAVEEQRFHVEDIEGSDFFRLVLATGHCLMAILGEDPQPPRLAKCDPEDKEQQWQWAKPSLRLGLKPASKLSTCLDTDNGQKPLMYVCYSMEGKDSPYGVENTNQAFWLTPEGHITQWGPVDASFSNLCLDGSQPPLTQRRLSLASCQDAEQRMVRWSKVGVRVPLETRLAEKSELDVTTNAASISWLSNPPRREARGFCFATERTPKMGDKKGGDEINYQQENDYMKRKIEVLRYRIMIKDEQILGCRKSEDGLRKRIAELDQAFEDEAVRCRENTAEMSRQYREMQESFNDTIDVLQKKVSEAKAEIESVTKEIEQVKIEKEEVLRQKDLEIASLSSKMETMAFEFADMLKETLDKMSQRIEVTHNSWDRDTTKPPLINRLKEFGLNDEPND
ncbi:unnamed protein product [Cladocopium goreaui]|uniref:Coiled-coil domain-containing protein 153 n=1 Tax=Cladocopium goreaui TaxID=2562237 RepID=A0A9P1FGU9_9DINO|nr:unnamed protein product [Cladocopium goreaui]